MDAPTVFGLLLPVRRIHATTPDTTMTHRHDDGLHALRVTAWILAGLVCWVVLVTVAIHTNGQPPTAPAPHGPTRAATPFPAPTPTPTTATPASVHYSSCTDAADAGIPIPIPSDHPAYNPRLDRNNNGWACE